MRKMNWTKVEYRTKKESQKRGNFAATDGSGCEQGRTNMLAIKKKAKAEK